MSFINNLIGRFEKLGRSAADAVSSSSHHPGDDTGRLILDAIPGYGSEEMEAIVNGYMAGYNARATELGEPSIDRERIRNGISWALPAGFEEELAAIPRTIDEPPTMMAITMDAYYSDMRDVYLESLELGIVEVHPSKNDPS